MLFSDVSRHLSIVCEYLASYRYYRYEIGSVLKTTECRCNTKELLFISFTKICLRKIKYIFIELFGWFSIISSVQKDINNNFREIVDKNGLQISGHYTKFVHNIYVYINIHNYIKKAIYIQFFLVHISLKTIIFQLNSIKYWYSGKH